jgi:hypothetical protein
MMFKHQTSLALLAGAVAATRWVFRSHYRYYLYDLDSANFCIGGEVWNIRKQN